MAKAVGVSYEWVGWAPPLGGRLKCSSPGTRAGLGAGVGDGVGWLV